MKSKLRSVLILVSLIFLALIITTKLCCAEVDKKDPNDLDTAQAREKPMIIWFHNPAAGGFSIESLETALSSGLITHVIVMYMHTYDARWNSKKYLREAIEIVKNSDAKLIWCRTLWAMYNVENAKHRDLFDPDYYMRVIGSLRKEAKEMGADFVALDCEAYANSPMKLYLRSSNRAGLNSKQRQQLKLAVKKAIQTVGKADFIFPAGSISTHHPYNTLVELGKNRISEHTYYDNEKWIKNIRYPYEIFGAFLNPVKRNKNRPEAPYFLASGIFEKSRLWSNKKGVFLFTYRNSLPVAKGLVAYSKTLPIK